MSDVTEIQRLHEALATNHTEIKSLVNKANEQAALAGNVAAETKAALDKVSADGIALLNRLTALEQKFVSGGAPGDGTGNGIKSLGAQFIESDGFKAMHGGRGAKSASFAIEGKSLLDALSYKTAIVNATGQNQPLVTADRVPGIIINPNRALRIRDLLPTGVTSSNLVEYVKENVFTNNAGPQYSSPNRENVTKPESGITFTLESAAVVTLAHFIPASRQVLDDSPMLQSFIDQRLMYGLKLEEEDQILNGTGTGGGLNGLLNQATLFNTFASGDTELDKIRRAIAAAQASNFAPTGIVLNYADWRDIELLKDVDGRYIFANPQNAATPQLWGLPVVPSNSIDAGTCLVGAFDMGAQLWDRQQARIEVSREDGDNFKKNMVTILAEERLALTVYRPLAFQKLSI